MGCLTDFQLALDFEFFSLVPTEGDISLEDLASKAGLDQDRTNHDIRMLITQLSLRKLSLESLAFSIAKNSPYLKYVVQDTDYYSREKNTTTEYI